MMQTADLLKRIKELEERVRELEARPAQHIHHHYPAPITPTYPVEPWKPPMWYTTCGSMDSSGHQQ